MITCCRECAAWDQLAGNDVLGICRRHALTVDPDRSGGKSDRFPLSRGWDYCFESLPLKDHFGPPRA